MAIRTAPRAAGHARIELWFSLHGNSPIRKSSRSVYHAGLFRLGADALRLALGGDQFRLDLVPLRNRDQRLVALRRQVMNRKICMRGAGITGIIPGNRRTSAKHGQHEQESMARQHGTKLDTHDYATCLVVMSDLGKEQQIQATQHCRQERQRDPYPEVGIEDRLCRSALVTCKPLRALPGGIGHEERTSGIVCHAHLRGPSAGEKRRHRQDDERGEDAPESRKQDGQKKALHREAVCPSLAVTGCGFAPESVQDGGMPSC